MHIKSIYKILGSVVLLVSCISCSTGQKNGLQIRLAEVKFVEKLSILSDGTDFETKFDHIYDLAVGPRGNIYVLDNSRLNVFKYSSAGEFITIFGRKGRGPGELLRPQGFAIMDSIIHIWDQNLQRMNQYDLQGNYVHQIPLKGITSAVKIAEVGRKRLLFYPERHRPPFESSKIAHLYNTDFEEVVAHFLQVGEINTELEEINPIINMSIGRSIEVISPITILYATPIYNNTIYEYRLQNSGDWALSAAHKGLIDQQPFTTVEGTSGRQPDVGYHSSHLDEPLEIIAHNQSRGLFKVQKYIFHFMQVDIGENREFGAEVYSEDFEPIGFIPITSIPITTEDRNGLDWSVEEADNQGNFYFSENYPDSSRVRKMHVNLKKLEEY